MRSVRPGLLNEHGRVWKERSVTRGPPGGCNVRPTVYDGAAGVPARPHLLGLTLAALAASRRPNFVVGCSRHDREGGPVSVEYLKQQLGANEKILYTERHHWIFPIAEMIKWILFALVVLVVIVLLKGWQPEWTWVNWLFIAFVVPAFRIAWGFISWRMNVYALTNRRVVEVTGEVNKTVADSSLEKLTDVLPKQSLFGRMLGYGVIAVSRAAGPSGLCAAHDASRPQTVAAHRVRVAEAVLLVAFGKVTGAVGARREVEAPHAVAEGDVLGLSPQRRQLLLRKPPHLPARHELLAALDEARVRVEEGRTRAHASMPRHRAGVRIDEGAVAVGSAHLLVDEADAAGPLERPPDGRAHLLVPVEFGQLPARRGAAPRPGERRRAAVVKRLADQLRRVGEHVADDDERGAELRRHAVEAGKLLYVGAHRHELEADAHPRSVAVLALIVEMPHVLDDPGERRAGAYAAEGLGGGAVDAHDELAEAFGRVRSGASLARVIE